MEYAPLILDIILIVIVLISAVKACNEGLFTAGVNLVGNVAGFFVAWFVSNKYSATIFDWLFKEKLINQTYEYIQSSSNLTNAQDIAEGFMSWLPQGVVDMFMEEFLKVAESFTDASMETATIIVDNLLGPIVCLLIGVVLFVIIIVICKVITSILAKTFMVINHIPILGLVNRLAGFFIGLAIGAINIILISCLLSIIVMVTSNSIEFLNMDILSASKILGFTSGINPFMG